MKPRGLNDLVQEELVSEKSNSMFLLESSELTRKILQGPVRQSAYQVQQR